MLAPLCSRTETYCIVVRASVRSCSRCVANECRGVRHVACFSISAAPAAVLTIRCTAESDWGQRTALLRGSSENFVEGRM